MLQKLPMFDAVQTDYGLADREKKIIVIKIKKN
jgi:hypothetical protein